jgi:precorrin-2 C(20)-methyltransferase
MMKLYSIGVGPGDSEDITIKATRILGEIPVVFIPVKKEGEKSFAYDIAKKYINPNSEICELIFPMHYDRKKLESYYVFNADKIKEKLSQYKSGAFIVIGDVTMYSTYMYINELLKNHGISIELVPGITSYSKTASLLGIPLAEWEEGLAIVPASKDSKFDLDKIFSDFQNIVIMKPSYNPENIVENLKKHNLENNFSLVCKAGTDEQRIITDINLIKDNIPYLSTMIVKKKI